MLASGGKGPTVLVVRDKQGHVFGGYASESWTKNGKFFGEVIIFTICCQYGVTVVLHSCVAFCTNIVKHSGEWIKHTAHAAAAKS